MEQTFRAVMCSHCEIRMTPVSGTRGLVQSYECGNCQRWVSGTYAELLEKDARGGLPDAAAEALRTRQFEQVKTRLARWMARLEDEDPYAILGVHPFATVEEVRVRYREEAFKHHPDRGGCEEKMAALNRAFERITQHQETRTRPALPAKGVAVTWRPPVPKPVSGADRSYRPRHHAHANRGH